MRSCALVLSIFLGTTTAGLLPALPPPTTVSPGEIERWAPSASICPTFSWAAIAGAVGYELRVVELQPGRLEDEASEVIARRIDGAATSWTPAGGECLTAGRFYAWFESLNGEFRYQLTPLGSWSACWVAAEIADHRFLVRGGPGARISWQVTGVRRDTWAEAHPLLVEGAKP